MDNAGCHPADVKGKFSNIKVIFLPANTISMLQPLDLGIIQNFKVYKESYFLTFVLAKIEECANATEIVKSVTVLHALRWVAKGWERVKSDTIQKCFIKAGILDRSGEVVTNPDLDGADPFADLDIEDAGQADLGTLKSKVLQICAQLVTLSVVIKVYRFAKSLMIIGKMTFLMVCQQAVNDLTLMNFLKVETKELTVMPMM